MYRARSGLRASRSCLELSSCKHFKAGTRELSVVTKTPCLTKHQCHESRNDEYLVVDLYPTGHGHASPSNKHINIMCICRQEIKLTNTGVAAYVSEKFQFTSPAIIMERLTDKAPKRPSSMPAAAPLAPRAMWRNI